jgi:hypothetical protein
MTTPAIPKLNLAPDALFLDNTKIVSYKECPRKYFLRHILDWTQSGTRMALAFGGSWHAGQDGLWGAWGGGERDNKALLRAAMHGFLTEWTGEYNLPNEPDVAWLQSNSPRTPFTAIEMFHNYLEARRPLMENSTLVSVEQPFAVPLYPDRLDVWYCGKLDKVIRTRNDGLVILEHKTTTEYKKDGGFKYSFLDQFIMNSQVDGYLYAGHLYYGDLKYVWVDAALVHDKIHDAFKILPMSRALGSLDEWLVETRTWVERINESHSLLARDQPLSRAFPRATNECVGKYGSCQFLHICSSMNDPHKHVGPPEGFIEEHWDPFTELNLESIFAATPQGETK